MLSSNDVLQDWEKELFAPHRWGRLKEWFPERERECDDGRILREHKTLKTLWKKVQPLRESAKDILKSIVNLEICNWNLEKSIMELCRAIGTETSPELNIGHNYSITDERWRTVWAYYLSLKKWLPCSERSSGYATLLKICDPAGEIQAHVFAMLGERTELKELYVERFCLNFEYWLGGFYLEGSPQLKAYEAAGLKLEKEIAQYDPDSELLKWMRIDGGKGWVEICHHKAFRRFDIHISSIGAGKWRGRIPFRGTDGLERTLVLEKYLFPIEAWIKGVSADDAPDKLLSKKICEFLGEKNDTKVFLASLLVSLLRSQQIAARKRAEKRMSTV